MKFYKNKVVNSIVAIGAGFLLCFILLFSSSFLWQDSTGLSFGRRLYIFFIQPLSSLFYTGNFLNTFFMVLITGTAALFPLITGSINIGGEGQVYFGGLLSAIFLNYISIGNSFSGLFSVAVLVILLTGFLGLISGILREHLDIPEILSTYLISSIIIFICDYLIVGPFKDSGNLIATAAVPEQFRFGKIFSPSGFNYSFIIIILIYVFSIIFFYGTSRGRQFLIVGKSHQFSFLQGYRPAKVINYSLFISSSLYGMAGFFAVTGTYYTCHQGFYSSWGWNGLTTALLGGTNIFGLIPASLMFSYLKAGIENSALFGVFSFETGYLVQGIVLLLLSLGGIKNKKTVKDSGRFSIKNFLPANKFFKRKDK